MKANNKTVLVTGGAGYIGSVLVKELLKMKYKVKVFDKLYFGKTSLADIKKKIEIIQGDVRQFPISALKEVDAVIHMGSLSNDPTADFNPKANHDINCLGTIRVAEACKKAGISRMTFASSAAVYGFHIDGIVDENSRTNPQSEYARSKLDAEKALLKMADSQFCPVILRQATVYGSSMRMRWDLVVNTMTKDAFSKNRIFVYCCGDAWRPLISVEDVAQAYIKCIEAPESKVKGQIFNLVYKNLKILDLANLMKKTLQSKIDELSVFTEFGTKESRSYRISGRKIRQVLGFVPKTSIEQSALKILSALQKGKFTDLSNPIYYNIDWMKYLVDMERKNKTKGKVF